MDDPLFARGFTLKRGPHAPRQGWTTREVGAWQLAHDDRVPFHSARSGSAEVAVLGLSLDTETWTDGQEAASRAAAALTKGEAEFFDVIDAWAGRHLICWSRDGAQPHVMTDAVGMRTCFFTRSGELMLASHAPLLAGMTRATRAQHSFVRSPRWRRASSYPGRITPWREIVFLTANTALALATGTVRRVWPRRPIVERSVDEAAERAAELISGQMKFLADSGRPLVVSLTGGIDSRTTLAAAREISDRIECFTYCAPGDPANEEDAEIAQAIAAALGLAHRIVTIEADSDKRDEETMRALQQGSFIEHLHWLAVAYRREFSQNTIHVRSNVAEVGQRRFDKEGRGMRFTSPAHIARTWNAMRDDVEAVAAFDEWTEAVGFWEVAEVDHLDLFHWEHRLSCWIGRLLLESDVAFDSHSVFNSRAVLEALLSVSTEDRRLARVFEAIIEAEWPALAEFRTAELA